MKRELIKYVSLVLSEKVIEYGTGCSHCEIVDTVDGAVYTGCKVEGKSPKLHHCPVEASNIVSRETLPNSNLKKQPARAKLLFPEEEYQC